MLVNGSPVNAAPVNTSGAVGFALSRLTLPVATVSSTATVVIPPTLALLHLRVPTVSATLINYGITTTISSVVGSTSVVGTPYLSGPTTQLHQTLPQPFTTVPLPTDNLVGHAALGTAGIGPYVLSGSSMTAALRLAGVYTGGLLLSEGWMTGDVRIPSVSVTVVTGAIAALSVPMLSVTGHIASVVGRLVMPMPRTDATVLAGSVLTANMMLPKAVASSVARGDIVSTVSLQLPSARVSSLATGVLNATVIVRLPVATVASYSGAIAAMTAPLASVSSSMSVGTVSSVSLAVPVLRTASFSSLGTVLSAYLSLRAATTGSLLSGYIASAVIRLPYVALLSNGSGGVVLSAALSLPVATTLAAFTGSVVYRAALVLPRTEVSGLVPYLSSTFMYVMNAVSGAVADIAAGAVALAATQDGTPVALYSNGDVAFLNADPAGTWRAVSAPEDMGDHHMKRLPNVWLGGRNLQNVVVITDGRVERTYRGGVSLQGVTERRVKVPRGIKSRYWQLGVSGSGDMQLDSVSLEPEVLSRRVR